MRWGAYFFAGGVYRDKLGRDHPQYQKYRVDISCAYGSLGVRFAAPKSNFPGQKLGDSKEASRTANRGASSFPAYQPSIWERKRSERAAAAVSLCWNRWGCSSTIPTAP